MECAQRDVDGGALTPSAPPVTESIVLELGSATDDACIGNGIYYRRLQLSDMEECKALHRSLFPIDYEEAFYTSALNEEYGIITLVAMQRRLVAGHDFGSPAAARKETMIGVVTARLAPAVEPEDVDVELWRPKNRRGGVPWWISGEHRVHTSAEDTPAASTASTPYLYILTLGGGPFRGSGTLESHRRLGIASELLEQIVLRAHHEHRCEVAYLHVITHNKGAIRFYKKHRFWQIRKLSNFYMLSEDKGPEKGRKLYDAYLFVRRTISSRRSVAAGRSPLAAMMAGWEALWRLVAHLVVVCHHRLKRPVHTEDRKL